MISAPLRIALLYLLLAALWIALSDHLLQQLVTDPHRAGRLEILGELAFVLVSALALFLLLRREHAAARRADSTLRERERNFRMLTETIATAIFLHRGGRLCFVNPKAIAYSGYTREELLAMDLWQLVSPEYREMVRERSLSRLQGGGGPARYELKIITKQGEERWLEVTADSIEFEGTPVGLASAYDITERKHHEAQLLHLATHDSLTGLPNRALYSDRLEVAILEAQRHERLVAAMYLNLDRFKIINDTLGHEVGNALLQAVAERLEKRIRDDDTLARLGADEFALVFTDMEQLDDVSELTQKILHSFKEPFRIGDHELFLTASIGIAVYPHDDLTPVGLLKNAAIALNRSKDIGGDSYQFYTAEMNAKALQHLLLDNALHHALARGELQLYYQPQVNLATGQVCGMEALLRWQHPELGMISPAEFIPLAEKTGLIVPIGEWVLRTACAQNKAWQLPDRPALPIAVNLSGRQFAQRNLAQTITQILAQTGLAPDLLELEITESTLIHNTHASIAMLHELNALGIAISIDDFGTGYSSLSYLKRFPINAIKIDQSFVRDIHTDPNDAAIVSAIIAMARSLGMKTIAEGVETNEQLTFLRSRQCDLLQGYYFSRPVTAEVITQMLGEGWSLSFVVNF